MKKYKLEIKYADNSDNCEYIEESLDQEQEFALEMDDNAVYMTQMIQPLLKIEPTHYYQLMNVALVGGCIIGDA